MPWSRRGVLPALGAIFGMILTGCAGMLDLSGPRATEPPAPQNFPECEAESYDFVGEGTLRGLGLHVATPVPPPDPDRPAMIWVTHDLKRWDHGEPGGPFEMVRMLCFEFADGSGGSEWPVDPTWGRLHPAWPQRRAASRRLPGQSHCCWPYLLRGCSSGYLRSHSEDAAECGSQSPVLRVNRERARGDVLGGIDRHLPHHTAVPSGVSPRDAPGARSPSLQRDTSATRLGPP
jgi:hypothetical protein